MKVVSERVKEEKATEARERVTVSKLQELVSGDTQQMDVKSNDTTSNT